MTNKPNLYIFVVDTSGSMNKYKENIEQYIFNEVQNIKKNSASSYDYVAIISYNNDIQLIQNPTNIYNLIPPVKIDFVGGEDTYKLKYYVKNFKRKVSRKFSTKYFFLITDKTGVNKLCKNNFQEIKVFDNAPILTVKDDIKQPIVNPSGVKIMSSLMIKLFFGLSFLVSISFIFDIKIDEVNIFPTSQKEEKELDRKTQPIINNIVQNTNITIINVFNQFKIDIKPTINFNFNFDTEINNQVNFHINIPYSSIDSSLIFRHKIENYELGKYNIRDSLITILIRRLVENKDINNYYLSSKNTKLKIIGETDSVRITGIIRYKKPDSLPYVDIDKIVFVNGKEQNITIRKWQQIKENYELGFLRAYFIGEFLKQKVNLFQSKNPEIEYHSKTNCCIKGGKYRTTEIELIIYDVKIPDM